MKLPINKIRITSVFLSTILALLSLTYLPKQESFAASVSWIGGTDSNWSTAANWSGGVVPNSTDDVLINVSATINLGSSTEVKTLTLGNSSGTTAPILNFSYHAISNGALLVSGGDLHIYSGGNITHSAGTSAVVGTININITNGDLIIDSGGLIDINGKGYTSVNGPGKGQTAGNTGTGSGGGHGGVGGNGIGNDGNGISIGGVANGSISNPVDLGSGGGKGDSALGGNGGGAILVNVSGTLKNNGIIRSNGTNGGNVTFGGGGGGSGGSINITTVKLEGSGPISANGGNGGKCGWTGTYGGGGAGGRIAISLTNNSYTGTSTTSGGTGRNVGGTGTIYPNIVELTSPHSSNITFSSATISATISIMPLVGVTDHGFFWSSDSENVLAGEQITKGASKSGGVISSNLSSLTPLTTYYFIPYAVYNGITTYGDQESFTTLSDNNPPTTSKDNITGAQDIYPNKPLTIQSIYSDDDDTSDLDRLYLRIKNPSGTDIEYYISSTGSNQTGQTPTNVSGSSYISSITYDTDFESPTTNDVTVTWHITPNWTWERDSNIQYGVKVLDKKASESIYEYTDSTYTYENRLTFTGTLQVTDSNTNTIQNNTWTGANLNLTFTGLKVVFFGTLNQYPLDSDFDVKLVNDETDEWTDTTSSGENISISATTPNNTNSNDAYIFSITNIPTGGVDSSNTTFTIKTDKTVPSITSLASSTHPSQDIWYSNTETTITWTSVDNQSGIDKVYRLLDQTEVQSANVIRTTGTETTSSGTYTSTLQNEGLWYMHLLVTDNVGLSTIQTYNIKIDLQNPLFLSLTSSTHPSQNSWYKAKTATVAWESFDAGSGIEGVWRLLNQTNSMSTLEILASGTKSLTSTSWTTPELTNGIWYFHLLAKDITGRTTYQKYILQIDATTPDIVAITGNNNGIWQNTNNGPIISWTDPKSPSDDTFYITNDGSTPSSSNFSYSLTTNTFDLPNQKEGETNIKVRALNKTGTYSDTRTFTLRYDSTAPANITSFVATPKENSVALVWNNPTISDFNKVILMRSETSYPSSTSDGTKIYEGKLSTYTDSPLNQTTKYYYTIFALDNLGNQSSGTALQTTTTTTTVTPPIQPTIPQITEDTKVINSQDLSVEQKPNVTSDNKSTTITNTGAIHLYTQQTVTIEVPASTITSNSTDTQSVLLVINEQAYIMEYNEERDSYRATIDTPSVKGIYATTIQTVSKDNTSQLAITISLKIDPYGYIYSNFFKNELRIKDAKVSLFTKKDGKEIPWQSTNGTFNPQITTNTGEFKFFVEPGEYKIVVEAKGYTKVTTDWFTVEGNIIEMNIKMDRSPLIYVMILGVLTVTIFASIAILKKKRN